MALLEVNALSVKFGDFTAVDKVSFSINAGEVVSIVGESGSGKSVSSMALMGLIDSPGDVSAEGLLFEGQDLLAMPAKSRRKITGADIAMIFQEPMTALNPCYTVGDQIDEALKIHQGGTKAQRRQRTLELLHQVGIPAPESRAKAYPHQLSGGMSQRVVIAMAIACNPKLLIADEPTTALDVTIQAQIMDLLLQLQKDCNMGLLLITHDLALVAEAADSVVVMYAGQVVETGPTEQLLLNPQHPYTQALLRSLPEYSSGESRLFALPGTVPGAMDRPKGCLLSPRCPYANEKCHQESPSLERTSDNRSVRCFMPLASDGDAVAS